MVLLCVVGRIAKEETASVRASDLTIEQPERQWGRKGAGFFE